jgi:hypothetical protein
MRSKICLIFVLIIFVFYSCEEINNKDESIASRLEGQWKCEENSSIFKSALDFYTVIIQIHPIDSNKVLIQNFYLLGNTVDVEATINGMTLTLPYQNTGDGYTVQGSGTIASNFDQINWSYSVDDGSGVPDEVEAV